MSDFRREIRFEPGFDKREDPDPKERQYGCHGMNIRFLLHGEKGTMQFLLYSGWLPGQASFAKTVLPPMGADVGYHWDEPRYDGQTALECTERPGGKCYYDGSGLAADELFSEFTREGEDAVWRALEGKYAQLLERGSA